MIAFIAFLLLGPSLPDLVLRLAGSQPIGKTDDVFDNDAVISGGVVLQDAVSPGQVVADAGAYGSLTLSSSSAYTIRVGNSGSRQIVQANVTESGMLDLCRQYSRFCNSDGDPIRNVTVDLRSGGGVIYGDISIGGIWQRVGLVVQLDDFRYLSVVGVDMGGTLYSVPPNHLKEQVESVERRINNILSQLTLRIGGRGYMVEDIQISEAGLEMIFR